MGFALLLIRRRNLWLPLLFLCLAYTVPVFAQEDGGETYDHGEEVLQSLFFPFMPNAPFSLTLKTEWVRTLSSGGTFTVVNERPVKRDTRGRLYEERWGLIPKGAEQGQL